MNFNKLAKIVFISLILISSSCSTRSSQVLNSNDSALVLLIDKSGSMDEEDKLKEAEKAVIEAISGLKDDDYVSVIGFDNTPFIIVDLQKVKTAKELVNRRLKNLIAIGQTNLLPALNLSRIRLEKLNVNQKHILILSDGKISNSMDCVDEVKKHRASGGTLSTIALGSDADLPFMRLLSKIGQGGFYKTETPKKLPMIFLNDVMSFVGNNN